MDGKNYTVMELAEQIGVPRTTINDWLGRYSQYIDTVQQGKRKVYPESALAVLREIAALRNSGKAFTEIETELSAKHPIRAVPVPPQEEPAEPKKPAASQSPEKEPQPAAGEGFALIARQQSEEIGKLIGESFRNMDDRIRELESISASQRRMSYFWLAACILFLLILAGGAYFAWDRLEIARAENRQLVRRQAESSEKISALKEQSVALIAGNESFKANIAKLESEMKEQKKAFENNLQQESKRLQELHQAQEKALLSERDRALMRVREQEMKLALEKEKFTAERLKLLDQLAELKRQKEALQAEQEKLRQAEEQKRQEEARRAEEVKRQEEARRAGEQKGQSPAKPEVKPAPAESIPEEKTQSSAPTEKTDAAQ